MISADAAFSSCGRYRWWLSRQWQPERPALLFIGLNPSRADGEHDDPTLRRIVGFARQWGFGSVLVLNLFARISSSPAELRRVADPVGAETDARLQRVFAGEHVAVWLGWGNQGAWRGRDLQVLALLQPRAQELWCLGLTAQGQPRHPLYAPAATAPLLLGPSHPLAQIRDPGASCGQRAAPPWPAPRAVMPSICT